MVDRLNKPNKGVQDWHTPVNENFEDVEEASYVERTVADFEGGTLPDAFKRNTSAFSVQSSVVESGSYAVEMSSSRDTIYSEDGLNTYPQKGDSFSFSVYRSGSHNPAIGFLLQDTNFDLGFIPKDGANIQVGGSCQIQFRTDNTPDASDSYGFDAENYFNEWLTFEVDINEDGSIDSSAFSSDGVQLGSASITPPTLPDTGFVSFGAYDGSSPIYFDSFTVERRETEARRNTKKGTTQLGNEVVPSGSIQTGPTTSSTNAERAIYQDAPVDTNATQGTQSKLTLLQSGLNPAMFMERTLDGQGGAYGHQLQAPLGRFARLNANLSWEYDSLADVSNWETGQTAATHSFALSGFPRKAEISIDGTGDNTYGGFKATPLTTQQSLDGFRVTWHGVNFTNNAPTGESNNIFLSLSSEGASDDVTLPPNKITFILNPGNEQARVYDSTQQLAKRETDGIIDYSSSFTASIEYDGNTARFYTDGILRTSIPYSITAPFSPVIQLKDAVSNSSAETLTVEQVTVEPLPEVLQ